MNKKIPPFIFLSLVIAISALAPVTHAQLAIGALTDTSGHLGLDSRDNNASSSSREASTTSEKRASATTSEDKNTNDRNTATTSAGVSGQFTADAHRSTVATFVQSLLAVADREGNLGEQVRIIAQAQKDSEATTTGAIEKVSSRGSLSTLFFGSDYANLGILRSGMVTTQNHLDRLNVVLASTTDTTDRAALTDQINALALDQASIQDFVTTHENSFSFFGWFTRLFVKTGTTN